MSRSKHGITDAECEVCSAPIADAYLCRQCAGAFELELAELPGLDNDLEITYSRQSRIGRNVGARSSTDQPVAWNEKAARAREQLKTLLEGIVSHLNGDLALNLHDPLIGPWHAACDHDSCKLTRDERSGTIGVARLSAWLLGNLERVRQSDVAGEIVKYVRAAIDAGVAVCSGPALTVFAGPCRLPVAPGTDEQCGAELYVEAAYDERTETAKPAQRTIDCPQCGGVTDVAEQREYLLAELDGMLVSAAAAAHVLAALGVDVGSSMIRSWKARGQIVARGLDRDGHPTYLISEIRALHEVSVERSARRRAIAG